MNLLFSLCVIKYVFRSTWFMFLKKYYYKINAINYRPHPQHKNPVSNYEEDSSYKFYVTLNNIANKNYILYVKLCAFLCLKTEKASRKIDKKLIFYNKKHKVE